MAPVALEPLSELGLPHRVGGARVVSIPQAAEDVDHVLVRAAVDVLVAAVARLDWG